MKTKIDIKNRFTGNILFEFETENNTVKKTLLKGIEEKINLSWADLSRANLSGAETDKRYIQIACIGSSKRMTTYCFEDNKIWCGCFTGTLQEFETEVQKKHKNNPQYLKEYLGFINYLNDLKK